MGATENRERVSRVCPRCGRHYTDYPAMSRADGKTPICPDCGVLEALETLGISKEEQLKILSIIHEHSQQDK